jgi:hypothetical protein
MNTKRRVQKRKQSRKRRQNIGGFWPFDKTPEQQKQLQEQQLQKQKDLYLFSSDKISIQSMPSDYKQIGIIHISDSAGLNFVRQFGTNVANTFGSKGFDNSIYDELRNKVLTKLQGMIENNNKVFNVRIDVESSGATSATVFVHLYGDLCEPTSSSRQMRPELEVERPDAQIERPNAQIERPDAQIEIPVAQPPVVNQV